MTKMIGDPNGLLGRTVTVGNGTLTWQAREYDETANRYVVVSENTGRRKIVAAENLKLFTGKSLESNGEPNA